MARFPAQGSGTGGGAGTGHVIQDEGTGLPNQPILDFTGNAVVASDGTGKTLVDINRYIIKNQIGAILPAIGEPPTITFGGGLVGLNDEGGTLITGEEPHIIKDEGLSLPDQPSLNFVGNGVVASDGPGNNTTVTIPGTEPINLDKLFETTTTSLVNTITALLASPVNVIDYSEFWLIVTGSLDAQGDIFAQINNFTSSEYSTLFTRVNSTPTSVAVSNTGAGAWVLNNSPNAEQLLINSQIYSKLVFQGGTGGVVNRHNGTIHSTYQGSGVGNTKSVLDGGIELDDTTTTLNQFVVKTDGVSNFNIGTKVSVYGVKTAGGTTGGTSTATGLVVETLFKTTLTTPKITFDAIVSPAVLFADYTEFWLVINGGMNADADLFVQINDITTTNYNAAYNFLDGLASTQAFEQESAQSSWRINTTTKVINERTNFYSKLIIQGGARVPTEDDALYGSIYSSFSDPTPLPAVTGAQIIKQGGIRLDTFTDTILSKFRIFSTGSDAMQTGTSIAIYGVKPVGAGAGSTVASGGGNYVLIGSAIADGSSPILRATFAGETLDGTKNAKFVAISTTELVGGSASGDIGYRVNQVGVLPTNSPYATNGSRLSSATYDPFTNSNAIEWKTGFFDGEKDAFSIVEFSGTYGGDGETGGLTGFVRESLSAESREFMTAGITFSGDPPFVLSPLTSFELVNVASEPVNFVAGSRLDVYKVVVAEGGGIAGHVIQDEGVDLTQEPTLDFVGDGVTVTDGLDKTIVTIPGGGGGAGLVEKLFDTTIVTPVGTITATISPSVNVVDYAEFWLIATGSLSATDDIFTQINNFTSSSYQNLFNRITGGILGQAPFEDNGSAGWQLNNTVIGPNESVLLNTQFYMKLVFQGGAAVGSRHRGSISSTYAGSVAGSDPSSITGHIALFGSITTLDQFVIFTQGAANFNAGTQITVYGVKI